MHNNNIVVTIVQDDQTISDTNGIARVRVGDQYSIKIKNLSNLDAISEIFVDGMDVLGFKAVVRAGESTEIKGRKSGDDTYAFKIAHNSSLVKRFRTQTGSDGLVIVNTQFYNPPPIRKTIEDAFKQLKRTPIQAPWSEPPAPMPDYSMPPFTFTGDSTSVANYSSSIDRSPIEDVITVKGEKISQDFSPVKIGELTGDTSKVVIKLVGEDTKRIKFHRGKVICDVCGTKNKSEHNFCHECGNNLG